MAKSLDLRKYQEDILARLKQAKQSEQSASHSRLGVKAGGDLLLVNLEDISEVAPIPEIQPVPLTRPWFVGVANVRGNLYGVSDLGQFAGHVATVFGVGGRMLLTHQKYKANAALLVSSLLGLRNLEEMQEQTATNTSRWGGRLFQDAAGESWYELNVSELISNPDFIRVGIG